MFFKRVKEYCRKHVFNPVYIKKEFAKNKSHIRKPALISNPDCVECGKNVRILYGARIECYKQYSHKELFPKLILKDRVTIGPHFTALISDKCTIGEDTIIAHGVTLVTSNHGMDPESALPYQKQELSPKEMIIGRNCWIGCNVVFVSGGECGDNCVVAAGSIVNKKFPDNVIIAGVPAKIVKVYDYHNHKWVKEKQRMEEF